MFLKNENIQFNSLKRSTSGFTNVVFFADDYVVKITNDSDNKKSLHKETEIYKHLNLKNIPKYISSGEIEDYSYLIISKIKGNSLYSIWYKLSEVERIDIVKQIANIIKEFHKQESSFLSKEFRFENWLDYISGELKNKSTELKKMNFETVEIDNFINEIIPMLFKENKFGLVYNDAHFDNFLYDGKKVSLIDFDRVCYRPLDYELMIFKTMCDNPSKFASEEDENIVFDKDFECVYKTFKKEYSNLYDSLTESRVKVYQFNYLIGQAIGIKNYNWAKELIEDFNEFIVQLRNNCFCV